MSTASALAPALPTQRETLLNSMRRHRLRAEALEARRVAATSETTLKRLNWAISAHRLRIAYLVYLANKVRS